jgi:hypothetical protein
MCLPSTPQGEKKDKQNEEDNKHHKTEYKSVLTMDLTVNFLFYVKV